ncbi:MAG: hypothetical protein LBV50_10805 [Novosphingobium sp.]|jgi:hypothetical protein|nr:hypothetical protein [Novosphingobium sp.]
MMEPAEAGNSLPRAFLRVGGATLAQHQFGIAVALECQRLICIAREISAELIALQREAERTGVQMHVIPGSRALAALVTANDEIIVFTEGLLADPQEAIDLMKSGYTVLVQPIESGLIAGFERIDINHAAAGLLRIPGRLVDQLADLPPDCDIPSALTRIALQARIAMQPVPATAREGVRWKLVRDEVEAHGIEDAWIRLHMGDGQPPTPGVLLSRLGVLAFGSSLLHAGTSGKLVALGALATMLMAAGAGWLGYAVPALLLCALGWTIHRAAGLLDRVEHDSLNVRRPGLSSGQVPGWLLDLVLILLVVWSAPPSDLLLASAFPPFILLCLVRLLPRVLPRTSTAALEDRALLALILAIAAAMDMLVPAVEAIAAVLAAAGLLFSTGKSRSTRRRQAGD